MSDDLDHLRNMPPPPPRLAAKTRALAAGLAAFREARAGQQNDSDSAKGNAEKPRLTLASSPNARSRFMRAKTYYALAASVAVAAIGAPMAFELWKTTDVSGRYIKPAPQAEMAALKPSDAAEKQAAEGRAALEKREADAAASVSAPSPVAASPAPAAPGKPYILSSPPPLAPPPQTAALPNLAEAPAAAPILVLPAAPMPAAPAPIAGKAKLDALRGEADRVTRMSRPAPDMAARESAPVNSAHGLGGAKMEAERLARSDAFKTAVADQERMRIAQGAPMEDTSGAGSVAPADIAPPQQAEESRDKHPAAPLSPVHHVAEEPVSTFSIDVDTASYAFARRAINGGQMPLPASVRVEEMVNYFPYDYPRPQTAAVPFRPTVTVAPAPWAAGHKLVHIAIKGYDIQRSERPRANIVLLVDVSGSMQPQDRLPLLKSAYRLLLEELQPQDTVAIVTYASGVSTALEPTRVVNKQRILAAIERLGAGGGTAGADGLQRAYQLAQENFDSKAVNRIILGTDGDFNLGISDVGELKSFIEKKRASGIYLSVLGVGHGNYNDQLMQALAQNGNGTAAYIDTLGEARKALAEEVSSTLFPIARDVKIQIEFNPAAVADYRLIGYETRALKREDFNNDKVDAGDIGSGHTVTAIYEITPRGAPGLVDDLRYSAAKPQADSAPRGEPSADEAEYAFLKLRYKLPDENVSKLLTVPVTRELEVKRIEDAPRDVRFSVAVAAFGQLLQGAPYLKDFGYDQVLALAGGARGEDAFGYRAEFMNLARLAKSARQ